MEETHYSLAAAADQPEDTRTVRYLHQRVMRTHAACVASSWGAA